MKRILKHLLLGMMGGGVPITYLLRDTFTDADAVVLASHTPDIGGAWTSRSGATQIHSNRATITTGPSIHTIDATKADFFAGLRGRITATGAADYIGLIFRYVDTSNYWLVHIDENDNSLSIFEVTSGSFSQRATVGIAIGLYTDYTLQVLCQGTSITAWLNGANQISYSSSVRQSATLVGIRGGTAGYNLDDFQVIDTAAFTALQTLPAPTAKLGVVLDLGAVYDTAYVARPHVIELNSALGRYHLYYTAANVQSVAPGNGSVRLALATSNDGLTWTKWGKIQSGGGDLTGAPDFNVVQDGASVHAYYSHSTTAIHRRTADNANYTSFGSSTEVLTVGTSGEWDDAQIRYPSVIKVDDTYYLYYMGNDGATWQIGLATSSDGLTFTKHASNPVIPVTLAHFWENTHTFDPHVFYRNGKWYMGYTGGTSHRTPPIVFTYFEQVGIAYSDDGVTWRRSKYNPWIEWGGSGAFDEVHVIDLEYVTLDSGDHIYYCGEDASGNRRVAMARVQMALEQ